MCPLLLFERSMLKGLVLFTNGLAFGLGGTIPSATVTAISIVIGTLIGVQ